MLKEGEFEQTIAGAQMVLAGIGEEFECSRYLKEQMRYVQIMEDLEAKNSFMWMIPYLQYLFLRNYEPLLAAMEKLKELLKDKNYYLLTVCMHGIVDEIGYREGRVVSPCGGYRKMQCSSKECDYIGEVSEELLLQISDYVKGKLTLEEIRVSSCPKCGKALQFNSLYAENYKEAGYLEDWKIYTKWLQGTLNRKLCVLELGVSLNLPTVIRFPFEKIAYFNEKAQFIRVHEKLYHLSLELGGKGIAQAENAVDFLNHI